MSTEDIIKLVVNLGVNGAFAFILLRFLISEVSNKLDKIISLLECKNDT